MANYRFLGNDLPVVNYRDSRVVIIPAPLEKTVSFGKGTAQAPEAILKASGYIELYDEEFGYETYRCGIHTHPEIPNSLSQADFFAQLEQLCFQIVKDNKFPVILGGEHSLSIAPIRAFHNVMRDPFCILHLDAHADLRDEYENSKFSHACVMRRIWELKIPHVSVGIRSLSKDEADFIASNQLTVFYAKDMIYDTDWLQKAVAQLTHNVYITLDVDVFDPSIISHTGTPEPGGMGWYPLLRFFQTLADHNRKIIGIDLVEFSPQRDHEAQSFTCAKLLYKMIGYFFNQNRAI